MERGNGITDQRPRLAGGDARASKLQRSLRSLLALPVIWPSAMDTDRLGCLNRIHSKSLDLFLALVRFSLHLKAVCFPSTLTARSVHCFGAPCSTATFLKYQIRCFEL